jgi:hypothetical protein
VPPPEAAPPSPPPQVLPPPDAGPPTAAESPESPLGIPYLVFKICWEDAVLPGSKARLWMLDTADHLIMTARRRKVSGHQSYQLFEPDGCSARADLEVQARGQQFTLKVPLSDANGGLAREIAGIAKDRTHNGLSLPYFHLLLNYGKAPYVAATKADRLGALAFRGVAPVAKDFYRFRSKVPELGPDKKPKRLPEIPEIAEDSSKNVVFVDLADVIVLKMYKMAEQLVSLHTVPFVGPLIGFAVAVAVIH